MPQEFRSIPQPRTIYRGPRRALGVFACVVLLSACGGEDAGAPGEATTTDRETSATVLTDSAAEYFEDALRLVAKKDYAAAIIQFRNAVQQAPDNLATRVELGKTLLLHGAPAAAERELAKARELGAHPDIVAAPFARALLEQGKFSELEREVARGSGRPAVEAELQVVLAEALLMQRELGRAEEALRRAQKLNPGSPRPLVRRAILEFERGNTDAARELAAEAERLAPADGEVWSFKGRLLIREGKRDEALEAYARARDLAPDDRAVRVGYARALLLVGQVDAAAAELAPLYRPDLPDAELSYAYALALAQQGKTTEAREVIDAAATLLAGADAVIKTQNPSLLMLSALVSYTRSDFETAHKDASMLVQLMPRHLEARFLLALIQAELGEPDAVIATLEPVRSALGQNGPMLLVYGEALRATGRARDAQPVLERALAVMPDSNVARVVLAQAHIMLGNLDAAIAILDQATAAGRNLDIASGSALVAALVREGDRERAVEVTKLLVERFPDNPAAATLAGQLEFGLGNFDAARTHLQRALAIDPAHVPARMYLAALERHVGQLDEARTHFSAVLAAAPDNTAAMFGLARIAEQEGDLATAYQWLEKLRAVAPRAVTETLYLAELYRQQGKLDEALQVTEKLANLLPEDAAAQMAYGQMLGEAGRTDRARTILRRSARYAGYNTADLKLLAARQLALDDFEGARATLVKALQSAPDDAELLVQLVRLDMDEGATDAALARIETLGERFPGSGLREFLQGEVLTRAGQHEEALAAYRAALAMKSDVNLVRRVHAQEMRLHRPEAAATTLERWLDTHPDDDAIKHTLAATYLALGRLEAAEPLLRDLLARAPNSPSVLNNLAWLLLERGAEDALTVAEQAYRLAPTDAAVLDTYGWALVRHGRYEDGLLVLREAIVRGGNSPGFQYRLAYTLHKLSRGDEARDILRRLLAGEAEFPEKAAAQALRAEIEG